MNNYDQSNKQSDIWHDLLSLGDKVDGYLKGTDLPLGQDDEELYFDMEDIQIGSMKDVQADMQDVWSYDMPENILLMLNKDSIHQWEDIRNQSQSDKLLPLSQLVPLENQFQNDPLQLRKSQQEKFEKQFSDLFKTKQINKGWKKNTNFPKFLVRIYMKYFEEFNADDSPASLAFFKRIKKQMRSKGSNAFKIVDTCKFFQNSKRGNNELGQNNRKAMARILRETSQDEIVESNYIHDNLKSYLVRSKVYALRCRSKALVQRVQIL